MKFFWIWIAINAAFILWRAVVAAQRPDVAPRLTLVRVK